jgi:hypothetical protein
MLQKEEYNAKRLQNLLKYETSAERTAPWERYMPIEDHPTEPRAR